ncbi:MAG TPA: O-antigen ligase family protein [Solirubrobacteraceae bacterium]|nr:O-antigen ligase family protein [Solirubrobacteraceae bacterium]
MIAATVTFATLSGGGFDASSRAIFVALAGICLLAAASVDSRAAARAARSPLALALVALAALSTLSVTWTIGSDSAALRWGLVIGGYAAVLVASATLSDATGPWPVVAGVAGLALLEAAIGLRAVSLHALPDAERLGGVWRPGGTFEYPPALALLEVATLPVLGYALDRGGAPVAGAAAAAATLAGAVLGLAGSRLALALAAAVLVALTVRAWPRSRSRAAAAATAGFVVIGAIVGPLALGGSVAQATPGAGSGGAIELAAVALAAAVSWPAIRGLNLPRLGGAIAAALCVVAIALAVVLSVGDARGGHTPLEIAAVRRSDVLHGRGAEWSAAFETWLDRPVVGAGADAYYVASVRHQTGAGSRYAHDLPLELAAELGALGLLLGLAIYASAAWSIATTPRTAGAWLLAPLVVAFLVSNLVDWTWHLAGLAALWCAASGAVWSARH